MGPVQDVLIVLGMAAQQDQLQALLHPPLEHALQLGEPLTIGIREGIVKDQRQGAVIGRIRCGTTSRG